MIVRFDSVPAAMKQRATHVAMAAAFFALSGVAGAQGGTAAAAASGASAAAASAVPVPTAPVVGRYPVRPGQSLHDIAVDLTQSHDKGLLARVSQALFDANPNAFAKHDPSRLKVGAVLNVPGVPGVVTGASGVAPTSAPAAAASGPAASAAPASAPVAPAAAGAQAGVQTPAVAHGASAAAAAGASATAAVSASAVQAASSPATGASAAVTTATASGVSGASAAAAGAAAQAAVAAGASAGVAASQPAGAATSPSDAHVWSGSIKAAPAASAASGAARAQAASSAPVPVSSLQQLLALKNRVLMALQKHGIGKAAQPAGVTNTSGAAANTAGAHGAAAGVAQPGATGAQPELSPVALGGAAAVGAALLALVFRLLTRKRKKPDDAADETPATAANESPVADQVSEPPVVDTPLHEAPVAAAEPRTPATALAAVAPAEPEPPQPDETLDHATDAASLSAAASLGGDALPPTVFESSREEAGQDGPVALPDYRVEHGVTPHGVEPGQSETLADASEAASFAAAAELGASALPPESIAASHTAGEAEELARAVEPAAQPVVHEPEAPHEETPQVPQHMAEEAPAAAAHEAPALEAGEPPAANEPAISEPHAAPPQHPQPPHLAEPATPAVPAEDMKYAEVPIEFPQDAVSAMGSIDMPLPPRVPEPIATGAPLSTEPVASPEATAAQAVPLAEPPAPPAGQAIEAGTAGPGAIAGLGAPRFGALTLDFDLNLPPDSAEPLPVFTPGQLARIARNKLELAHEYIALGDLAGARSLINEVIESNDPAMRGDAQALLSTLAPLS